MYQLGWFSTGRDKAARDLLETAWDSIQSGEIKAEIAFVFCSREPGESPESDLFLKQVEGYHIPLICFSYQKFKAAQGDTLPTLRLAYDHEVMKLLNTFNPDLCVLAGHMLIVGKEMCRRYNMLNLHPATPGGPTGTWQEVIWQLIDGQAQETGVMMHLATPELDKGPVVTFCTFSIRGEAFDRYWRELAELSPDSQSRHSQDNPLFKLIRKYGLAREFPLIIATIKAFTKGRVKIAKAQVVDAGGKPINGYDLTGDINKAIKERGEVD